MCVCVCFPTGLLFLSMMFLAFGGMAEVPIASQARKVVLKQHAARMYGIPSFVISNAMVFAPLAILDTFVFGSIVYWYALVVNGGGVVFAGFTFCCGVRAG